jgi:hypothetical protein
MAFIKCLDQAEASYRARRFGRNRVVVTGLGLALAEVDGLVAA